MIRFSISKTVLEERIKTMNNTLNYEKDKKECIKLLDEILSVYNPTQKQVWSIEYAKNIIQAVLEAKVRF